MTGVVTQHRQRDGGLQIKLNGKDHPAFTARFAELEATRSPTHRRNFLRRAIRFVNARLQQGHDGASLFANGPASFREELARWHRNESGRFAWDWDGEKVTVFWGGKTDLDMTQAINLVLGTKMASGRRKYVDFLMGYLNHEVVPGENRYEFVTEAVADVRYRVMDWVRRELELIVDPRNGSLDSSVKVKSRSAKEPINTRALGIAAVRQLYENMAAIMRLRSGANPLDVDGWAEMTPSEKIQWARRKWPKLKFMPKHAGAQFEVDERRWYPPIPHDPVTAGVVIARAVDATENFPKPLRQLLEIMRPEGNRFHDAYRTMLSAWAESDFGKYFHARNKASHKEHAKKIFLSPRLQEEVHQRIDDDHLRSIDRPRTTAEVIGRVRAGRPVWPSMAQVRELKAMGSEGMEVLGRIPMFPSTRGRPYAYTTWNNHYLRPALLGDETARIQTTIGPVRPTPIWLRRSMYTLQVARILETSRDEEEIDRRFRLLARDKGLAGTGPIYRYAASAFPAHFAKGQAQRAEDAHAEMMRQIGAMPEGSPIPAAPALSPGTQARRSRARD